MRLPSRSVLLSLVFIACAPLLAQTTPSPHRKPMLALQFGPVVKNAPVSAIRVLDFLPAEGAGAQRVHGEEMFFRDSSGRTRSEIRYEGGQATIWILDHIAHTELTWHEGETVAHRMALKEYPVSELKTASYAADAPKIDGVPTRYGRGSSRIDPSETIENWYSVELQMALDTEIDTPGWGKTSLRFTHIKRSEPDPKLFSVPDGMTVDQYGAPPPPPVLLADKKNDVQPPSPFPAVTTGPQPAYMSDPKFQKALDEARNGRGPTEDSASRWKKTVKLSNAECIECLKRLIGLQEQMGASKDVQTSAEQLDKVATLPADKFMANLTIGQMLMRSNFGSPKPREAEQAETHYRAALAIQPRNRVTLFEHGRTLAVMGRDEEAKAEFKKYVDLTDDADRYHLRATRFADNPHLATLPSAPPFKLVTAQGEQMELDDMHGKVVLLDFWATWCGPCKESLPEIQRIAKDFKDEPLVVISISSDRDIAAWKKFMQDHNMDWPQYRDSNGALQSAYGVNAIPHYFTIDSNGVLQTELIGSGADVRGKLKKLVKQAREFRDRSGSTQVSSIP